MRYNMLILFGKRNVLFLVIESADFSNKYIRPIFGLPDQNYGIVTIRGNCRK